jgi:hypothetical protein
MREDCPFTVEFNASTHEAATLDSERTGRQIRMLSSAPNSWPRTPDRAGGRCTRNRPWARLGMVLTRGPATRVRIIGGS